MFLGHFRLRQNAPSPFCNSVLTVLNTRTQLMDEFWDADTETAPRAVDVYMTKLRTKLSDCNEFEIKTVHGLGYKAVIK